MAGMTWAEVEELGITYEESERLHITFEDFASGLAREKVLKDRERLRKESAPNV